MLEAKKQKALYLSSEIIRQFCRGNNGPLFRHIHEDVLWIGSFGGEVLKGRSAVRAYMKKKSREMPPLFLENEQFDLCGSDASSCTVAGTMIAHTMPDSGTIFAENLRITVVWQQTGQKLSIIHIHDSGRLRTIRESRLPVRTGALTHSYIEKAIEETRSSRTFILSSSDAREYRLTQEQICAVYADRNYTVISFSDVEQPTIRIRETFGNTLRKLPFACLVISRSIAVNPDNVDMIGPEEIHLKNGERIRITSRKHAEIRRQFEEMMADRNGLLR